MGLNASSQIPSLAEALERLSPHLTSLVCRVNKCGCQEDSHSCSSNRASGEGLSTRHLGGQLAWVRGLLLPLSSFARTGALDHGIFGLPGPQEGSVTFI